MNTIHPELEKQWLIYYKQYIETHKERISEHIPFESINNEQSAKDMLHDMIYEMLYCGFVKGRHWE